MNIKKYLRWDEENQETIRQVRLFARYKNILKVLAWLEGDMPFLRRHIIPIKNGVISKLVGGGEI